MQRYPRVLRVFRVFRYLRILSGFVRVPNDIKGFQRYVRDCGEFDGTEAK